MKTRVAPLASAFISVAVVRAGCIQTTARSPFIEPARYRRITILCEREQNTIPFTPQIRSADELGAFATNRARRLAADCLAHRFLFHRR